MKHEHLGGPSHVLELSPFVGRKQRGVDRGQKKKEPRVHDQAKSGNKKVSKN